MPAQRIEDQPADLQPFEVTCCGSGRFSVFLNQPVDRTVGSAFTLLQETVESEEPVLVITAAKLPHSFNVALNHRPQMTPVRG
jgi:hypothetical protein